MEEKIYHLTSEDIKESRELVREIFTKVRDARSLGKTLFDLTPKETNQRTGKRTIRARVR
jgi:hypothetical protein